MDGLQGPFYLGTGCFHRRKVVYGAAPPLEGGGARILSPRDLESRFGNSGELMESAAEALSGRLKTTRASLGDLSSRVHAADHVASCTYELGTCWGKEVGLVYGSTTEDVQTGLRVHAAGWRSANCLLDPPGFMGGAPVGGPASLAQIRRWSTGLLQIVAGWNSPLWAALNKKLGFRQCLCYLSLNVWALRSLPELCYALLPPFCFITNTSFLPKVSEAAAILPAALFAAYNASTLAEYLQCGQSARSWWNNQRMLRIMSATAWLFALLSVVLKTLGISETVFEISQKGLQSQRPVAEADEDPGRFTFDASPLFVPATALVLLNLASLAAGSVKMALMISSGGAALFVEAGPGLGELLCSAWVVLSFWPFVRGLFKRGSYGLPWPTITQALLLASLFFLTSSYCGRWIERGTS